MMDLIIQLVNLLLAAVGGLTILFPAAGMRDYFRCKLYELNQHKHKSSS